MKISKQSLAILLNALVITNAFSVESAPKLKEDEFNQFMRYCAEFGKTYDTIEEIERRAAIYFEKDKYIKERNAKEKGSRSVVSHNKFSDWT